MSDAALKMDAIYRWQTQIYDLTRRHYLLGRDTLIECLAPPASGGHVLEIGCGTGRNLIKAARRWPGAVFFGLDISNVMLDKARQEVDRAGLSNEVCLVPADATRFDSTSCFGRAAFDRIYFSYTLSMIPEWTLALDRASALLAPGGALLVADFGDQAGLPVLFRKILRTWLSLFHVEPRDRFEAVIREIAARRHLSCEFVPIYRGYAFLAALRRPIETMAGQDHMRLPD